MSPSPIDLSKLPPELLAAAVYEGSRDADRVATFLDALSKQPRGQWLANKPLHLPAPFLLALGAALRLYAWESNGIFVHREAGLPSADEALKDAFRAVTDPEIAARIADLPMHVDGVFMSHFAWTAPVELNADITLGKAEEDQLLEALADFLWANRRFCETQEQ